MKKPFFPKKNEENIFNEKYRREKTNDAIQSCECKGFEHVTTNYVNK